MGTQRVATLFQGSVHNVFLQAVETDELDIRKSVSSIAPNFVHSLDASAMLETVLRCECDGVSDFSMIHDSYAVHARYAQSLAENLREAFVYQYQNHDPLLEFCVVSRDLMDENGFDSELIPDPPAWGELEISDVLTSQYFFN